MKQTRLDFLYVLLLFIFIIFISSLFTVRNVYATNSVWSYTINVERKNQQANFCNSEEVVRTIIDIFQRVSHRAGYSALSNTNECWTGIRTFTPKEMVGVILIKSKMFEYNIYFVRVEMKNGKIKYLFTTREVNPFDK